MCGTFPDQGLSLSLTLAGGFLTTGPQGSPTKAFNFCAVQYFRLLPELLESHVGSHCQVQRCEVLILQFYLLF